MMKKRLIILIDFSEYSAPLLKYAFDWSKRTDAELVLVHQTLTVVPSAASSELKADVAQQAHNEALHKLTAFAIQAIPQCHNISFRVGDRPLQSVLSELLDEPYENLVFIGLKGTGVLKKLFLGSVAIQVIEESAGIVAAIPKDVQTFTPETLFVGVKEEYTLNVPALNTLLVHFGTNVSAIKFFSIIDPEDDIQKPENYLRELSAQFADKATTSFSVYQANKVADYMKEMIQNNPNSLLVVQKGSRLLKDHILRQFLINKLIYSGKAPLIVLP